jgi:hypothetical protein
LLSVTGRDDAKQLNKDPERPYDNYVCRRN